jgi:hypothetical protein
MATPSVTRPDKRAIVLVQEYPQVSETYIKNEVAQLARTHDVELVTLNPGNYPYRNRIAHIVLTRDNQDHVLAYLRDFAASVLHAHYLHLAVPAARMARALQIPYTVRCHSYDVLGPAPGMLARLAPVVNQDECLGVLAYPFLLPRLLNAGIRGDKLHGCFPVVDVQRFLDRGANGDQVMNVGAALPKKNMLDFSRLSALMPGRTFNLYAMGYEVAKLRAADARAQGRVNFIAPVEPEAMPREYKKHEWLVYTASEEVGTVGWPLSVAEAQASGVGVLMQHIRDDMADYVGEAGYLFKQVEEAAEILRSPFPPAMRERGFALAARSDIRTHITTLTDLWP